ncbi:MAG TPA: sulfite oxidase [bacterium]|nr:sulfite oxidase [bacterium]
MTHDDLRDEDLYRQIRTDELAWHRAKTLGVSRRRFLQIAAAGAVAAAAADTLGRAAEVSQAAPADLIVKSTPPEWFYDFANNKEMRWENMASRGYVVPNELFFVRDHTRTPRIEVSTWRLKVEGSGVSRPLELSYDDILGLPETSVIRYVECAGNGRSFFEAAYGKAASGTQWKLGAIGVAEWTGVPLREVLDRAGLKPTARDVMPEGLDELRVRRPMSIAKALEDDTLLVYAMNGSPLPPDHGFPVRVLTPGWVGVANTKWVGRFEVSEQPIFTPWNTDSYVLVGPTYTPVPPSKGPVLTTQSPKSAFELPWDGELPAGRRTIRGRSWSPFGKITRVEYSTDRGVTWQLATMREPNIPRAWVRWDFEWEAKPGSYSLRARATDEKGNRQPATVPFNEQGYLFNAVVGHPLTIRS